MTELPPGNYVGMPAAIRLDEFARRVADLFGTIPYLVGSAIRTKDWRDVDVRLMLADDVFDRWFPGHRGLDSADPRWAVLCDALSELAKQMTGLPVDFQIQRASRANERYKGERHPLGMRFEPAGEEG